MADYVLDASAVLAVLNDEDGAALVEDVIGRALISSVNLTEVASKLVERGMDDDSVSLVIHSLPCRVVDFTLAHSLRAGQLRRDTGPQGLSLGDRACLALTEAEGLPVLTSDRRWSDVETDLDIRLIR